MKVTAQEDGLDRLAEFSERLVGGVLNIVFGEAPQDGFRFRRPQTECRGVLDHLIVLLTHQVPVDRFAEDQLQDQLQVREGRGLAGLRAIELLRVNGFQSGQQQKAEQPAEGERDRALAVRIDVLSRKLFENVNSLFANESDGYKTTSAPSAFRFSYGRSARTGQESTPEQSACHYRNRH